MSTIILVSANSDIAKACARVYARVGHNLVLASRNLQESQRFAEELNRHFAVAVQTCFLDSSEHQQHPAAVENIFQQAQAMGGLAGIIVCTGYLGKQHRAQQQPQEARLIINSNFTDLVLLIEHMVSVFPQARCSGTAKPFIAVISSVAGERGRQSNYIYGSAKAGLNAYLSGLRNRCHQQGLHIMTVKAGYVDTKMTEGLTLPPLLTATPDAFAKSLYKAQRQGRDVVYIKAIWRWMMLLIRLLPEALFKRLSL